MLYYNLNLQLTSESALELSHGGAKNQRLRLTQRCRYCSRHILKLQFLMDSAAGATYQGQLSLHRVFLIWSWALYCTSFCDYVRKLPNILNQTQETGQSQPNGRWEATQQPACGHTGESSRRMRRSHPQGFDAARPRLGFRKL